MYGVNEMTERAREASRIKTLRLALGPGASAITQLAAALRGRGSGSSGLISVAGFCFPYFPGFPVLAYPGRRPLPPSLARRTPPSP